MFSCTAHRWLRSEFDLHVPGVPFVGNGRFSEHGSTLDHGQRRLRALDSSRDQFRHHNGADDLAAGSEYVLKRTGAGKRDVRISPAR